MRCREALKRLNQLSLTSTVSDPDLVEHLRTCRDCAQKAQASQLLAQDFQLTSAEADDNITPLSYLKTRLESQIRKQKEPNFMAKIISNMPAHKRLGVSLTAVFIILLALSVIPFSFDKTIGYEVAFAGVNKDLAMDQEKINSFLIQLGINGAEVEVSDCTETCKLIITALKSPADAQIIKAALLKSSNVEIFHDISEIKEHEKNTFFGNVIRVFQEQHEIKLRNDMLSDDEAVQIVVEKLGEDVVIDTLVFFAKGSNQVSGTFHGQPFTLPDSAEYNMLIYKSKSSIDTSHMMTEFIFNGNDSIGMFNGQKIQLKNGQLDQATVDKIKSMGYSVEVVDEDGQKLVKISGQNENSDFTAEHIIEDDESAAKIGDLPDQFELNQNYPNPFNPTTNISFTLPTSEHVSLYIYNVYGQLVKTLLEQPMSAGSHTIEWNATDQNGNRVASGIYLYRLVAGKYNATKKMSLIK